MFIFFRMGKTREKTKGKPGENPERLDLARKNC